MAMPRKTPLQDIGKWTKWKEIQFKLIHGTHQTLPLLILYKTDDGYFYSGEQESILIMHLLSFNLIL